jgi:hypothetical protein
MIYIVSSVFTVFFTLEAVPKLQFLEQPHFLAQLFNNSLRLLLSPPPALVPFFPFFRENSPIRAFFIEISKK